jgi:AcrR family transcriptional regulator
VRGSLTPKGEATRARIIEGAALEIRENGVAGATLDAVRSRTGTSKSQLFHYFPEGKEQLLMAVARYEASQVLEEQQPYLSRLTSWPAWRCWRDALVERYREQGDTCPLRTVTSHLGPASPGGQAVAAELLGAWQDQLAGAIGEMRARGLVAADLDVDEAAAALMAGIQGGVLILMSTGRATQLEAALDVGIRSLRAPALRE